MGMYTKFVINARVKGDSPTAVINVLRGMCSGDGEWAERLDHPFFETQRGSWMFQSHSYYHSGDPHATLRWDDIGNFHMLTVGCDLKNYSDEIEKFVDWITPYLDEEPGWLIGYMQYEDADSPTLFYAHCKPVVAPPPTEVPNE